MSSVNEFDSLAGQFQIGILLNAGSEFQAGSLRFILLSIGPIQDRCLAMIRWRRFTGVLETSKSLCRPCRMLDNL